MSAQALESINHTVPTLREPTLEDATAIWELARDSRALDLNSPYAYLLVCAHHAGTSVVAESRGRVVGFVSAYRPPEGLAERKPGVRPDPLFISQIGVGREHRGAGLATRMLLTLLDRPAAAGVRYVEATVATSNHASRRLFQGLSRRLETDLDVEECFARHHFPDNGHEAEELFRVGPIGTAAGGEQ